MTITHYHKNEGDKTVYHGGSLADCPESTWTEVVLQDGRIAKFYHGMSITLPPNTSKRLRYISDAPAIG